MLSLLKGYLTLLQLRAVQSVMHNDLFPVHENSGPIIRGHLEQIFSGLGRIEHPLKNHPEVFLLP